MANLYHIKKGNATQMIGEYYILDIGKIGLSTMYRVELFDVHGSFAGFDANGSPLTCDYDSKQEYVLICSGEKKNTEYGIRDKTNAMFLGIDFKKNKVKLLTSQGVRFITPKQFELFEKVDFNDNK